MKLKYALQLWREKKEKQDHKKEINKALQNLVDFSMKKESEFEPLNPSLEPLRHFCMPRSWESIQYLCNHPIMKPIGWRYAANYALEKEIFQEAYEYLLKLGEDVRYVRMRLSAQGEKLSPLNMTQEQLGFEMFLRKEKPKEAFKKIPHFIPLSLLLKEDVFLLETYKLIHHRSLAGALNEKDPLKRFKTLEAMTKKDDPEGAYVLAQAAKEAGLLGEAKHFEASAKQSGQWVCKNCHYIFESQWPWCHNCYAIDSFVWK